MRGCRCRNAGLTGWQKVQTCRGYPLFAPFAPSVRFALHPPPLTFQVQVLVGLKRQTGVASRCNAGFLCIALPCHTSLRGNFCSVEEMPEILNYCGQRNCTFWLYWPSPFPRNNLPLKALGGGHDLTAFHDAACVFEVIRNMLAGRARIGWPVTVRP